MMKTKLFSLVVGLLILVVALAACAAPAPEAGEAVDEAAEVVDEAAEGAAEVADEAAGEATDEGSEAAASDAPYVAIVSKGFQHQFWQAVNQGAEQAAEELGVTITFEGPESESQVDKQVEMVQAALARDPDALCLAALDSQALIPQLQAAQEAGIPVIGFDSGVESDIPVTTAATDNIAAAALAADKMAELIGGEGQVAVIVHDQTSQTGIDRRDGFVNRIESEYPDIEIVDIQYGGGDHLRSTDLAKAIMQANPELDGFFGANEGSAIGVLNAVTELGREGEIVVIGYDSGQQQIEAIRNGVQAGAITQNPIGIGYECVQAAVQALNGEELPEVIDTGFYWYDASNVDDEEIQAVLYE